jgi:hypothetical protein
MGFQLIGRQAERFRSTHGSRRGRNSKRRPFLGLHPGFTVHPPLSANRNLSRTIPLGSGIVRPRMWAVALLLSFDKGHSNFAAIGPRWLRHKCTGTSLRLLFRFQIYFTAKTTAPLSPYSTPFTYARAVERIKRHFEGCVLCLRFATNHADGRGTRQGFPPARFSRPMTEPSPVCTKTLR